MQEGTRLYCGACSWQGTLVEPFPLPDRSVCLTCRRPLTDPVSAPEKSAESWATAAMLELTTARRPGRVLAWVVETSTSGADWCAKLRVVMDGDVEPNELVSGAFGPDAPTTVRLLLQEIRTTDRLPMEVRDVAGKILDRED